MDVTVKKNKTRPVNLFETEGKMGFNTIFIKKNLCDPNYKKKLRQRKVCGENQSYS